MQAQADLFDARSHHGVDFSRKRSGDFLEAALSEANFSLGQFFGFSGPNPEELQFAGLFAETFVDAGDRGADGGDVIEQLRSNDGARFGIGDTGLDAFEPFDDRFERGGRMPATSGPGATPTERGTHADGESGSCGDCDSSEKIPCH